MDAEARHSGIRKRMKLRATPEEVWAALTVAEELVRWFPLQATVEPGVGGSITSSWNGEFEGTADIVAWEPLQRLATERRLELPEQTVTITEDWTLEARGGAVHVHLEQRGFPESDAGRVWADACARGWDFELRGLRHAVERHPGVRREVLWCRRQLEPPIESVWDAIMSERGLGGAPTLSSIRHGDRYEITPSRGPRLSGCLQLHLPPHDFAAMVEDIEDAYLRLRLDPPGFGVDRTQLHLWLSTFGVDAPRREEIQRDWESLLDALFPRAAAAS